MAQLGPADMQGPIGYAFSYPQRLCGAVKGVNFFELGSLTFEKPDLQSFRCLDLAYQCLKAGGSYPVVLNAANEVLVQMFLSKKIGFLDIQKGVADALDHHTPSYSLTLEQILDIDRKVRSSIEQ